MVSRIVLPSARSERTVSHAARRASGSKPVVGSSRKISSGSPTSASAKSSRRSWPPREPAAALVGLVPKARQTPAPPRRRADGVEARPVAQRLARGDVAVDAARLQHDADPPAQRQRARGGVLSQHRHLAAAARAVALEDLDRRGLARPVGPEQPEHLAAAHLDVDAAHRLELAVALAQVPDLDRGRLYQCTPLVSVAIAICSKDARSSTSAWPLEAAESGNTR